MDSPGLIQPNNPEEPFLLTTGVLPTGVWVHVVATYDHNTGLGFLYINGHLRGCLCKNHKVIFAQEIEFAQNSFSNFL